MKSGATTLDAYKLIHDGVLALARAERSGIRIDTEYCQKQKKKITRKINHYQRKLENTKLYKRWARIYRNKTNIHSNQQLSNILYKHMGIKPMKITESGQGSTDENTLRQLGIPELETLLKIRKLLKIRDTYLDSYIRETNNDGFMRPSFNLHNVRTYRSSSADPNFQNIPKRDKEAMEICRRAIIPRPGHMLIEADFSSLEVNIACCYHRDPVMMKYLQDESSDMHSDMAKQIFLLPSLDRSIPTHAMLRQAAKNSFVFPQFYGDYYGNNARGLCDWVKLPLNKKRWKQKEGVELLDGQTMALHLKGEGINGFDDFLEHMREVEDFFWNKKFRVYQQWKEDWVAEYYQNGYLRMFTGFVCSGVMKKNEIVNYPIQGTAFHCLLATFIKLDEIMYREQYKSFLIGQIHDSLVLDVYPPELEKLSTVINDIVQNQLPAMWDWIIVPLEIEIDTYGVDQPWI